MECDNCGFIGESIRPKSKSSSSSSRDTDKAITTTKSSKLTNTITYHFKCPNCSPEKTVLEHNENYNDEEDDEDDDDNDNEDESELSYKEPASPMSNRIFLCSTIC